jgi:hypothetical protein
MKYTFCQECQCRIDYGHNHLCSQATKFDLLDYIETLEQCIDRKNKSLKRFPKQVTLWQGKFMMVKNENNKMRRNIKKEASKQLESALQKHAIETSHIDCGCEKGTGD